jgi:hypothetical protein
MIIFFVYVSLFLYFWRFAFETIAKCTPNVIPAQAGIQKCLK